MDISASGNDYDDIFSNLKQQFNATGDSDIVMDIDSKIGKLKCLQMNFPIGLEIIYLSGKINEDLNLHREEQVSGEKLVFTGSINLELQITHKDQSNTTNNNSRGNLLINNTYFGFLGKINKNTPTKFFSIRMGKVFLQKIISHLDKEIESAVDPENPVIFMERLTPQLLKVIDEIEASLTIEEPYLNMYLTSKAIEFITFSLQLINQSDQSLIKKKITKDQLQIALKIRDLILNNMDSPLTIPEISKEIGISPTFAKTIFNKAFGLPIYSFYQSIRMEKAKELIEEGKLSIKDIAFDIGYSNVSHFTRSFRKKYGINPKQYAMRIKE
ncbi:helix-turn-helix domain-containing protein [Flammeovirga kamogawensis]|uniref:Helix-turn-helix transcriptional regulator n=1 Tax=Flammeovirga kamogawensis TaxID=373891 RepID=A0ABX8GT49_9BACT|nr:AraC family transcriptional regulator [Flammeovirga kamogawensis]MBB6462527.1 AraC-like DNA-binding protein [Flammeovirga kamogawensis]QWG06736.1 helix-turn-helix transcriptional regulator [Flammeovirga kamogawensis]TRX68559.1 helix-turn-helix transcriptional regulator [Flammeovirga kamogawensis]